MTLRINFMVKNTIKMLASLTSHLLVASRGQSWRVYPKEAILYVTARRLLQNGRHLGPVQRIGVLLEGEHGFILSILAACIAPELHVSAFTQVNMDK